MRALALRSVAFAAALLTPVAAGAADPSPAAVIDRQLEAYNAHNLDAFVATFAPNAELFELPDKPLAKGTAALRERYAQRFADPILRATIAHRTVLGNKVVDHEQIRRTWPEGPGSWEAVAISEVENGLVVRVWFILGDKKLDPKK